MQPNEPVLQVDENRFVLFPIRYPTVRNRDISSLKIPLYEATYEIVDMQLWEAYKTAQKTFWTTEEIDFTTDLSDWNHRLTDQERSFFSTLLAFFATSDGIVAENLAQRFCAEIELPEARCFYGFQMMMWVKSDYSLSM